MTPATPFIADITENELMIGLPHGQSLIVGKADVAVVKQLAGTGDLKPAVSHFIRTAHDPALDFVDVGSHVGFYACLAAKCIGDGGGQVYAIEPHPALSNLLQQNLALNGLTDRVRRLDQLARAESGQTTLFGPKRNRADSSRYLKKLTALHEAFSDRLESLEVDGAPLADLVGEPDRVGTIKIDVNGAELDVLQGAIPLLDANPRINLVIRWDLARLATAPLGPEGLVNFLVDARLMVRRLDRLDRFIDPEELYDNPVADILATVED